MKPSPSTDIASSLGRVLREPAPPGLVSAYLFGSHAEGRAHGQSDVDVGVLLAHDAHPTARDRFQEGVRLCALLVAELGTSLVDLVVLDDAPPHLARRIVTAGCRVFCSDPPADHAFVRDVQLKAADLEPFLRRSRRLKLAALAR